MKKLIKYFLLVGFIAGLTAAGNREPATAELMELIPLENPEAVTEYKEWCIESVGLATDFSKRVCDCTLEKLQARDDYFDADLVLITEPMIQYKEPQATEKGHQLLIDVENDEDVEQAMLKGMESEYKHACREELTN